MKTCGVEVCLMTRPLYSREKAPGIHRTGVWVGSRVSLDVVAMKKIPDPPGIEPRSSNL